MHHSHFIKCWICYCMWQRVDIEDCENEQNKSIEEKDKNKEENKAEIHKLLFVSKKETNK